MNASNWKVEVIADNSGKFYSNGLLFANKNAAWQYAVDLADRWTSVRDWRVVEVPVPAYIEPEGEV